MGEYDTGNGYLGLEEYVIIMHILDPRRQEADCGGSSSKVPRLPGILWVLLSTVGLNLLRNPYTKP